MRSGNLNLQNERDTIVYVSPKRPIYESFEWFQLSQRSANFQRLADVSAPHGRGEEQRDHGNNDALLLDARYTPGRVTHLVSVTSLNSASPPEGCCIIRLYREENQGSERAPLFPRPHSCMARGWWHWVLTPAWLTSPLPTWFTEKQGAQSHVPLSHPAPPDTVIHVENALPAASPRQSKCSKKERNR